MENKYLVYAIRKQNIDKLVLTAEQYEAIIKQLAEILEI